MEAKVCRAWGVNLSNLPELPSGWLWTNLSELKEYSLYGPRFSSDDYSESGTYILRTTDIDQKGKVNLNNAPRIELSTKDVARYKCEVGDMLITRTGSLGRLAVYNDSVDAIPGAYLIQYRLASAIDTVWWVYHFLMSPKGQNQLIDRGTGIGRQNLNLAAIESIPIPLPPLNEQRRIIKEIEDFHFNLDIITKNLDAASVRATQLRHAILKSGFNAQLVPQNSADEPADALLQRIKEEREKRKEQARTRKTSKPKEKTDMPTKQEPQSLFEILVKNDEAMTPNQLFEASMYAIDEIESFYEELRAEVDLNQQGRVNQVRPNDTDVFLEVINATKTA